MNQRFKLCLISLWVFGAIVCSVGAQASEKALRSFLEEVNTLNAEFTQRVMDERGSVLEASSGVFYLSRPGKFRWDYKNPDFDDEQGQQIVADGESLYFYDPDLEQVSKRSLENAIAQVPSLLLVMSNSLLDQHFNVQDKGQADALTWVALTPKAEDAGYQKLLIGFLRQKIDTFVLYDGLGNATRLELSNVETNGNIDVDRFVFKVPPNADLLGE